MEEKTTPVERNMDRRLVERNLRKGIISHADIEAYEGTLKDVSDNLEVVSIDDEEGHEERSSRTSAIGAVKSANGMGEPAASVTSIANSQGGA